LQHGFGVSFLILLLLLAMPTPSPLYRHGDVLLAAVAALPMGATPILGLTLAHGEVTGHSHRIHEAGAAQLFRQGTFTYLLVTAAKATLVHEEHRPIELPAGVYRVWQQREYTPTAIRTVVD
jgi:hypothetical protein